VERWANSPPLTAEALRGKVVLIDVWEYTCINWIILPFTAGEVNLVVEPGPSGAAALTVLLDGIPVGDAHGADVGADSVARFDRSGMLRLVAGASRRRHVLTLVATDPASGRSCSPLALEHKNQLTRR
jgi:hypothetical protein